MIYPIYGTYLELHQPKIVSIDWNPDFASIKLVDDSGQSQTANTSIIDFSAILIDTIAIILTNFFATNEHTSEKMWKWIYY